MADSIVVEVLESQTVVEATESVVAVIEVGTAYIGTANTGTITGPVSSTNLAVARWDGTTGAALLNSSVTIDGSGNISLPSGATVDGVDVSAVEVLNAAHRGSTSNPHNVTAVQVGAVPTTRTITTSAPLAGGGALSGDLTLSVSVGTTADTVCAGNDSRLSDTRTPTDASVTSAKLDATLAARMARLVAVATLSGTSGSLLTTHRLVKIDASGHFSLALPSVSDSAGLDFLLHRIDIASAYTLTLVRAGSTERIRFLDTIDTAGSLALSGADSKKRPGFLLYSDGTDWWVA